MARLDYDNTVKRTSEYVSIKKGRHTVTPSLFYRNSACCFTRFLSLNQRP